MDVKEASVSLKEPATTFFKPTTGIAQTFTKEYLKILEITEYCKIAESSIREYEVKVNMLTSAKNESARLKVDYANRNRINMTNSESLLQAKNELNKYKCELKSNYIATEKALNSKRLKYKKIISSYQTDWERTLKEYNDIPVVKELHGIQEKNSLLENEIDKRNRLQDWTQNQFSDFKVKVEEKFLEKIVEFSKVMVQYKVYLESQKRRREEASSEEQKKSGGKFEFIFLKTETPKFKTSSAPTGTEDVNGFPGIDVSIFDEIMVPSENLEIQDEEEDVFPSYPNDQRQSTPTSEENMDITSNETQYLEGQNEMVVLQQKARTGEGDEKESQYFRHHHEEYVKEEEKENSPGRAQWIHSEINSSKINKGELDENLEGGEKLKSNHRKAESEKEVDKKKESDGESFNAENEDTLSEGSVDNQRGYSVQMKHLEDKYKPFCEFDENYENQYRKNSMSSDDNSVPAEHSNDNSSSPFKLFSNEQPSKSKGGTEKDEFKSFTGFFTMGGEQNSPKPSIFKLF